MPHVSVVVRRDSGSGLSTSTIIIIAVVAGSVVVLVFVLFAWRVLARWCRRSRSVPLPPVQDLAHHREQQLAAFTDRKLGRQSTWADPSHLHPPVYSSHLLSATGSSASLIRGSPDFTGSRGPTRENSWNVEDTVSAESSPYPLSTEVLQPPNPSFLPAGPNPHYSMSSVASTSSDVASDLNGGLPASPSEMTHSVESSAYSHPRGASPARLRPPRTPRARPSRPMSVVSSAGTLHSVQSSQSAGTVLRGAPHSIHSSVQIVLPAPLAPELYPHAHPLADAGGGDRRSTLGGADRRSVADPWVTARMSAARGDRGSSAPRSSSGEHPLPHGACHRRVAAIFDTP